MTDRYAHLPECPDIASILAGDDRSQLILAGQVLADVLPAEMQARVVDEFNARVRLANAARDAAWTTLVDIGAVDADPSTTEPRP